MEMNRHSVNGEAYPENPQYERRTVSDLMWYVIQVRAGRESVVAEKCERFVTKGEEVFVPLIEMERRVRGEDELKVKAMFPGYLFFDTTDVEKLFYRLKRVEGLTKIVRTGDEFTPISQEEKAVIEELAGEEHFVKMSQGYKDGDSVTITDGPLKSFSGEIIRIDRRKRTATLEVMLLGEAREIKVGLKVLNRSC